MSNNGIAIVSFICFVLLSIISIAIFTYFNKAKSPKSYKAILREKYVKFGNKPGEGPIPKYRLRFTVFTANKEKTIEFYVNEKNYQSTPEGICGTITLQGLILLSFKGSEFDVDYTK